MSSTNCDRVRKRPAGVELNARTSPKRRKQLASIGLKRCSQCRAEKSLTEFAPKRTTSDGLMCACRPCQRKIQHAGNAKYKKAVAEAKVKLAQTALQSGEKECDTCKKHV